MIFGKSSSKNKYFIRYIHEIIIHIPRSVDRISFHDIYPIFLLPILIFRYIHNLRKNESCICHHTHTKFMEIFRFAYYRGITFPYGFYENRIGKLPVIGKLESE